MHRYPLVFTALVGAALLAGAGWSSGCGGSKGGSGFGSSAGGSGSGSSTGGSGGSSGGSSSGAGSSGSFGDGGLPPSSSSSGGQTGDGGIVCPPGLMCNVSCTGSNTTTITGKVYDPAGKNPLYNVAVYVPATALQPLPKGVPTGADACSCAALFKSGAVTSATTDETGSFTLTNAPVGSNVPLVLQVGKWRRSLHINVAACQANAQPDKSLTLPGTVAAGSDDNMPDIAVSTGSADSLECLMLRIGLPASEYVAGAGGGGGHFHVYSGGGTGGGGPGGPGGGGGVGRPEANPMPGAPASDMALWDSPDHLMPYDITILSCEGGETYNANPQNLETYLNAGGRVFASHFHYAWFSGPIATTGTNTYTAPADWGNNLATWAQGGGMNGGPIGGIIDTTLNGSTMPFPKGVSLQKWLTNVGALGGVPPAVPAGELSIYSPRFNAVVNPTNKPSQPWITADMASGSAGQTMYFSFDTPVNAPASPDGGPPNYCGRAVFSDLHVAGDPSTTDMSPPPGGCASVDLSNQEKALEFMLFDLSSCVIPDNVTPPPMVPTPPQ
jgi:hypothetical protein